MSEENKVLEYDEDESLKFIQKHLPEDMQDEFTDDEINYIVDLVYEFTKRKVFLTKVMNLISKSTKMNYSNTSSRTLGKTVSGNIPTNK